jgi:hypothetical protein
MIKRRGYVVRHKKFGREEAITMRKPRSKKSPRKSPPRAEAKPAPGITIRAWEDDPGSGVLGDRPVPDLAQRPLAYAFPRPAPKPAAYQPGTPEFRFWTTAEALRRGADFWANLVPLSKWEVGPALKVLLDEGADLNAFYDRKALNFFHGPSPHGTVFSAESPDVACHEMGHAILDSFKPQLWDAASHEVAAFHESFGDMSAILSALQLPSLRTAVLSDTGGHLFRNSRLSRLAEQLGAAIRAQEPDAVDPDCLRNAVNSFTYQDPIHLPPVAPARQLSSEAHSFSRVFTGAFFESLGSMLAAAAQTSSAPSPQELLAVATDLAKILVQAVQHAPVVPNWFAQVAAGMVQIAGSFDAKYPAILKGVFVKRSILSLQTATSVVALHRSMAGAAAPDQTEPLAEIALSSRHYGLDRPLLVQAASHPRPFAAMAAAADASPIDPASAATAAQGFVDDLFRSGHVDYNGAGTPETRIAHGRGLHTHRLVPRANGIRLERRLFNCGFCCGGPVRAQAA